MAGCAVIVPMPVLLGRRHHKLSTLANALGPALHDGLLLGIEAHTFFAIGVHVAKQRALPAAKAVPAPTMM